MRAARPSPPRAGPIAAALVGAAMLAGCAGSTRPGGTVSPVPTSATSLTVEVTASPGATPRVWTLTCDPAGGDHPDAPGACAQLAALAADGRDPFAPVPAGMACTQIYGGPQTARVTGTFQGRPVDAAFRLTDGCEIARWTAVASLLGDDATSSASPGAV